MTMKEHGENVKVYTSESVGPPSESAMARTLRTATIREPKGAERVDLFFARNSKRGENLRNEDAVREAEDAVKEAEEEIRRKVNEVKKESDEAYESFLALYETEEGRKLVRKVLLALKNHFIYSQRKSLSEGDRTVLKEATVMHDDFLTSFAKHPRIIALIHNGNPNAKDSDLAKGFNAWRNEQEDAAKAKRKAEREAEGVKAVRLRRLATGTLHKVIKQGEGMACVEGPYTVTEKVEREGKNRDGTKYTYSAWVPRMETVNGVVTPVTRWGLVVLQVKTENGVVVGQIPKEVELMGEDGVPYTTTPVVGIRGLILPHPDRPIPLDPDQGFNTDKKKGNLFFRADAKELVINTWSREEREAEEKARREERRRVDTTMAELLKTLQGQATGSLEGFKSQDRVGNIQLWVRGDGTRLYLKDAHVSLPPQGFRALDFKNFPEEGIALQREEGEHFLAGLVRHILYLMVEKEAKDKANEANQEAYRSFCEEKGDTVQDMGALLEATSVAVFTRYFRWDRGYGQDRVSGMIAMRVGNTGSGLRGVKLERFFTTVPMFEIPVGTEVPASLELGEDATDAEKALVSMLRYCSGRKVVKANGNGASHSEPDKPNVPDVLMDERKSGESELKSLELDTHKPVPDEVTKEVLVDAAASSGEDALKP